MSIPTQSRYSIALAIAFAVALAIVFALSMTLFLGISQFGADVRTAFDVRLGIAADDVAEELGAAARVGVSIQRSPPITSLLERALRSDPMIAAVVLRDPLGAALAQVGHTGAGSRDVRLTVERPILSDFGVSLGSVQVTASQQVFAARIADATVALVGPAIIAGGIGIVFTSAALLGAIAFLQSRERARRLTLEIALQRRLTDAEASLAAAEAALT